MVSELLQKYIWLVQTFVRAGRRGLTLGELCDRWELRFDSPYSRRTFNNHREAVEEVFGLHIECDRSSNIYYIENSSPGHKDENEWLINTFTVNNMLTMGKERLSGRVSVEDIPSGHIYLTAVMEAMTENHEMVITYRKYRSESSETFTIRPYAVKESARRWYIVAWCLERKALRVYGLDRVKSLEVTDRRFRMPKGFDVDELFATSFGIYLPESKACSIRFKVPTSEAGFIRDLPLHHSQVESCSDGNSVTFSIFACPNRALIMEFCRYGSRMEILSPEEVRQAVAEEHEAAAAIYGKDK